MRNFDVHRLRKCTTVFAKIHVYSKKIKSRKENLKKNNCLLADCNTERNLLLGFYAIKVCFLFYQIQVIAYRPNLKFVTEK